MRSFALACVLAVALAVTVTCSGPPSAAPLSPSPPIDIDGGVYRPCTTFCWRPRDCAVAYPDDGQICPPDFLCGSEFRCAPDGGGA